MLSKQNNRLHLCNILNSALNKLDVPNPFLNYKYKHFQQHI